MRAKNLDRNFDISGIIPIFFNLNANSLINFIFGIFQVEWFPRVIGNDRTPGLPLVMRYSFNIICIFQFCFCFF